MIYSQVEGSRVLVYDEDLAHFREGGARRDTIKFYLLNNIIEQLFFT